MPSDESKGSQLDAIGSLAQRQLDNTARGGAVCLRRKPPDGDVQTGRLPEARRNAYFGRPLLGSGDLRSQTRLPGERITPVDGPIRSVPPLSSCRAAAQPSTGTQSPKPRCRPAPITTGPHNNLTTFLSRVVDFIEEN